MLKLLLRALVVVLPCFAYAGFADAFTLRSEEGHFTAEFPREPKFSRQSSPTGDGTPAEVYQWIVDNGDVTYMVAVTVSKQKITFDYDKGTNGFVKAVNGKLISQQPVQMQGKTGREIFVEAGGYIFRDRMLFVNQRIHQIAYGGKPGTEKSADAEVFLNSLQLRD
jgi:hypothetical protein